MSSITTLSKFYYGTLATLDTRAIDFNEGAGDLVAHIPVNDYSPEEYVDAVAIAMSVAGTQAYVGTFDRTTRKMTISAPLNFSVKTFTGPNRGVSAYDVMGFNKTSDYTGSNSYEGELGLGEEYVTQYPVNAYVAPEDWQEKQDSTVNETPGGIVEQITYGDVQRIQMNIRVITDKLGLKNRPFYENATGVADARAFIAYIMKKAKVEFMPDRDQPSTFHTCYLNSIGSSKDGSTSILTTMGAPGYYETGVLQFRKVEIL